MKKNKPLRLLSSIIGSLALSSVVSHSAFAGQVLEFKLEMAEDGETYEVWMRPSVTPKPDISLTGQVTIKVPTDADFKVTEVTSAVDGADWLEASRVNAPEEDLDSDYISFSFVGLQGDSAHSFQWNGDEDKLVFTFKNEGGCVAGVGIMANDDLFNAPEGNSVNTNPGNQFTNLGWGGVSENNFDDVYGETNSSCS